MREVVTSFFDTGACRHLEALSRIGGAWRAIVFPSVVALIRHPEAGPILFDAGYDPAFLAATQRLPERLYRWAAPVEIPPGRDAASQCRAAGVDPDEIGHVVLSHFHGDHVAGLHRFAKAQLHCARAGLEDLRRGSRLSTTRRGLLAALLPPGMGEVCAVVKLDNRRLELAVPGPAYAAKLRQMAPSLAQALAGRGWLLDEIAVRVQAGMPRPGSRTARPAKAAQPLGAQALEAFDELGKAMRPGPLADAIARLLAHHGHRRS